MYTHEGGCHCGNMRWTLTSRLAAAQLPVRACQSTFCRKQAALGSSDPAGTLRFAVRDPAALPWGDLGVEIGDHLLAGRNLQLQIRDAMSALFRLWFC